MSEEPFLMNPRYSRYELGVVELEWDAVYDARFWQIGYLLLGAFFLLLFTLPVLAIWWIVLDYRPDLSFSSMGAGFFVMLLLLSLVLASGYYALFHALRQRYVARRRFRRLRQTHRVITGEIIESDGALYTGYGESSAYHIMVRYQFQSPSGATLAGRQQRRREDLRGQPIPPSGTPVRVLYADDDVYVML